MTRAARLLPAVALAALALTGPGCASLSEYRARGKQVRAGLETFRYRQPVEQVWPVVRRLLADRGLTLAGKDAAAVGQKSSLMSQFSSAAKETRPTPGGGLLLETAWNQDSERWRAEAEPDAGGLRVVFTRIQLNQQEFGSDGVALRDHDLEFDLLQRIDPDAAERIEEGRAAPAPAPAAKPAEPPAVAPATSPAGQPG
jgi:hypothetical protein